MLNALLCRAAVGLIQSHAVYDDASDLTQHRLDLFAEIGAVEVVKGAVSPPTPGTSAWWRAAVREAVYAPLGGPAQYVRDTVNWTSLLKKGLDGLRLLQRLDPRSNLD